VQGPVGPGQGGARHLVAARVDVDLAGIGELRGGALELTRPPVENQVLQLSSPADGTPGGPGLPSGGTVAWWHVFVIPLPGTRETTVEPPSRIRRVHTAAPGFTRRRRGRGFSYLDQRGQPIADHQVVERIRTLAIPPAWSNVWISPDPLGHLQASGTDAAGRKQYLYHERWRRWRDRQKFHKMHDFARSLPELRRRVEQDLKGEGLTRERVLACAVRLLDLGFFRIGSESYATRNGSFGLATMRKEHVKVAGDEVLFDYTAKGGKRRVQAITDLDAKEVLRRLKGRRNGGSELLAYSTSEGWKDVRSLEINDYIKETGRGSFSAKDFRTWHGTVLAAVALATADDVGPSLSARKRGVAGAIREVAEYLGNTPAVARASYVDPRVLDRFLEGETIRPALGAVSPDELSDPAMRLKVERAVLDLIESAPHPGERQAA
jgi:DNA topoisomerase I